jgi:RNA recognition motif-containing protein
MTEIKRNYLYLYDLPKDKVTSVKIGEAFKQQGIDIGDKKPQISRDLFKPFYSAIVMVEKDTDYNNAINAMRYFKIDDCQARSLPFDKDLRGENKEKVMNHNIFFKLGKDEDKNQLTYQWLHQKFEKYGRIKSTKISLNPDFSNRGFAFVCFQDEPSTKACLDDLGSTGQVFKFKPKDGREIATKIQNNLYFKNIPSEMSEGDVKKLFAPFGDIKSLVVKTHEFGKHGFVCYDDKTGKNKMHGTEAVQNAIKNLQDKDMGNGMKLYIRAFLNKQEREREKFQETIRYKTSKKRCNLYVKNFPSNMTEQQLTDLFKQYGEIEKVRLEKGFANNTYAFVCFKKPDACSLAKQELSKHTIDGKPLIINHYEIKEIRDLQLEEVKDKRDWETYRAQNGGFQWNNLTSQPNLTQIIQQLLQLIQQQNTDQTKRLQPNPTKYQGQPGGNKPYPQNQNRNQGQRYPNQNMNMGYNQQQQPMKPQVFNQGMPQQPGMHQGMIPQQPQQLSIQHRYMQAAMQLLPSVQERNPYVKEQVGHLIFDYVEQIQGKDKDKAPKITGMLIELPLPQIRQYMQSYEVLQARVEEANRLLA